MDIQNTSGKNKISQILEKYPVILQLAKFAAMGFITSAVDFLTLNFLSKLLGVEKGWGLAALNAVSFSAAVIHSYIWNKHWAFERDQQGQALKNFGRAVLVGIIGVFTLGLVFAGSQAKAGPWYFIFILACLMLGEVAIWKLFGLSFKQKVQAENSPQQFGIFLAVSIGGTLINSGLVGLLSTYFISLNMPLPADTLKNLAKVAATVVSLVWNFVGYKVFVFKK